MGDDAVRVLFATTVVPTAKASGGEIVSAAIVDALRQAGHAVRVLGYVRPGDPPLAPDTVVAGERPIETADAPRATVAAWLARALATRRAFSEAKYVSAAYRRLLAAEAARADVVVVDHAQLAWLDPPAGTPVVFVAHNVEQALYEQAAANAGRPWSRALWRREARRIAAAEARLARRARAVWTLTGADRAHFAALGADARVLEVPATAIPSAPAAGAEPRVALLGTWSWAPNLEGLRWFLDRVVPRLPEDLDVVVGGRGAPDGDGRVRFVGRVPDAGEFLAGSAVVAVPALAGAGLQIKTLDAIASGATVVATPTALRGIDDVPASVRVADTPEAFAQALTDAVARPEDPEVGRAWARGREERFVAALAALVPR